MPKLLWALRIAIIVAFIVHIVTSIQLSLENRAARPVKYAEKKSVAATLASRTMLTGGLVVLAFLLYHLAHLTFGITNPDHAALIDDKGRPHIYNMMVLGFQNNYVSVMYIVAQVFLAFHLAHGFGSAAQTLGLTSCKCAGAIRVGGQIFAIVLFALYISIPIAVMTGWLHAA
jgi:succinate dehydrogenase / fumarate reductase cytochrome b subunit